VREKEGRGRCGKVDAKIARSNAGVASRPRRHNDNGGGGAQMKKMTTFVSDSSFLSVQSFTCLAHVASPPPRGATERRRLSWC
jgi:hypothetical protein